MSDWLASYRLLLLWQARRFRNVVAMLVIIQVVLGLGIVYGLSFLIPRLVRAISLGRFAVEWQCGVNFEDLTKSGLPTSAYGFPHCVPCIDGFFPPTGRNERMHMVYMSRVELLAIQRETIVRLRADRDDEPVDAALAG